MSNQVFDVLGIGNAIIDIISLAEEKALQVLELQKGSMSLVDEQKTEFLYDYISCIKEDYLTAPKEMSGGSVANTVAGVTSFGGTAAFIGKVSNDYFGNRFVKKLRERGVAMDTPYGDGSAGTGRSLIIVSKEDASRTMCTYLGAAQELTVDDVDEEKISHAKVTFIEGYLLDCAHGRAVIDRVLQYAKAHGSKIALTLSDSLCVKRHYDDMWELVENHVDILFANSREINALCNTDNHDESIRQIQEKCAKEHVIAALTCTEKGVIVIDHQQTIRVEASQVKKLVDSTGTGDLFAAGFLYGFNHGYTLAQCGALGNIAAAEVLQHLGARPKTALSDMLPQFENGGQPLATFPYSQNRNVA